jgi:hypothetical protein
MTLIGAFGSPGMGHRAQAAVSTRAFLSFLGLASLPKRREKIERLTRRA